MSSCRPQRASSINNSDSLGRILRHIRANPIYRRESGYWGDPNPYFAQLKRFAPLIILAAVVLGLCVGNTTTQSAILIDENLAGVWCLFCLPNIVSQTALWSGNIFAPALTAPAISQEVNQGSWEILRLTPFTLREIVLAKLFGSLARLKLLWRILAFSSILQALLILLGALVNPQNWLLWLLITAAILLRPWVEIFFHALLGAGFSLFTQTGRSALILTYSSLFGVKIITFVVSITLGIFFSSQLINGGEEYLLVFTVVLPPLFYIGLIAATLQVINLKTRRWDRHLSTV